MDLYLIYNAVLIFTALMLVNYLDRWSTKIGFRYNDEMANNDEFRGKMIAKQKGDRFKTELNPIARVYMRKFGVEKGMTIFSLMWNLPWAIMLVLFIIFKWSHPMFVLPIVTFYFGALYMQIFKSFFVYRIMKKNGIDV